MSEATFVKRLPFNVYFSTVVMIGLIGLADSIYLSISHYRVYTDMTYQSFCAISRAINCDTVSQSPYSILFNLPLSVWGILGYLFVLALMAVAWNHRNTKKNIWPTLFFISLAFSIHSLALGLISSLIINSYCIMCIVSYAVNFAMLFYCWLIYRRFESDSMINGFWTDLKGYARQPRRTIVFLSAFALLILAAYAMIPSYWHMDVKLSTAGMATGRTADGHPWIGAEQPELTITEFSDYQCFQCKKMHFYLRQLIADNPGRIRLIHRHFPMDHNVNPIVNAPFHIGSGKLAKIALFALEKEKFWEVNDHLFHLNEEKKTFNLRKMAADVDLDVVMLAASVNHPYIKARLSQDIREGMKWGMTGTPGFVIEGKLYSGQVPAHILERF
ncbi:MAG: hypothetical protein CSA23_03035 [Deltaproteobacteria bacterium]|nr:MAG: hypothetical protein CSA23_03035 [Deltaproteobacteria bacterium]